MKKLLTVISMVVALTIGWYIAWHWMLADDVARVKATIAYHNVQIKTANRATELRAHAVYASGFPFHFRVRVERPTLSYIFNDETYSASLRYADLTAKDSGQGSYEVSYPRQIEALYAKSGAAPESYVAIPDQPIDVLLRAQGDSQQCSNFPGGKRCDDVDAQAPLISYAARLPSSINLTMTLNGKTKTSNFQFPSLNLPIYRSIPADMNGSLQLFVGVLREAMVYQP
jgi:hypothetical protein